ncbi:MAG: 50S ribosomal protein L1 [Elusimicrobia bacterium]|jgi:large subunit ribosomal protein L1|nr:50S ribosomal protein L1 [Elusimicrobiota bacterium]
MRRRIKELQKQVDPAKRYSIEEAVSLVKQTAKAKFDETVEIHVRLGVDAKKGDQNVRGTVSLPFGTGKSKKVVVVAKGDKLKEAQDAGADEAGEADIIEKISKGWLDFDVLVATPDAMRDLTKLAKTLGPKGLMPNPKSGTVTFDIARTVKELKAGRVEFKMDSTGIVHSILGKASFPVGNLVGNARAFLEAIENAKPSTAKGTFIRTIAMSSTMGPGVGVVTESVKK